MADCGRGEAAVAAPAEGAVVAAGVFFPRLTWERLNSAVPITPPPRLPTKRPSTSRTTKLRFGKVRTGAWGERGESDSKSDGRGVKERGVSGGPADDGSASSGCGPRSCMGLIVEGRNEFAVRGVQELVKTRAGRP